MINENTWKEGENLAVKYMKKHGFRILKTNFSCVGVELDIVAILPKNIQKQSKKLTMKEKIRHAEKHEKKMLKKSMRQILNQIQDLLVITEVKSRSTSSYGEGFYAVTEQKQHNIIRGARYLQTQKEFKNYQIRFDVASVDKGQITYIEGAFR